MPAFDVFLCHRSADKSIVHKIDVQLREWRLNPWLDDRCLEGGDRFRAMIEEQLRAGYPIAVFIGKPNSDGKWLGRWQDEEIDAALSAAVNNGTKIIPVFLPDAPVGAKLTLGLNGRTPVDFRKVQPEPVKALYRAITGTDPPVDPGEFESRSANSRRSDEVSKPMYFGLARFACALVLVAIMAVLCVVAIMIIWQFTNVSPVEELMREMASVVVFCQTAETHHADLPQAIAMSEECAQKAEQVTQRTNDQATRVVAYDAAAYCYLRAANSTYLLSTETDDDQRKERFRKDISRYSTLGIEAATKVQDYLSRASNVEDSRIGKLRERSDWKERFGRTRVALLALDAFASNLGRDDCKKVLDAVVEERSKYPGFWARYKLEDDRIFVWLLQTQGKGE